MNKIKIAAACFICSYHCRCCSYVGQLGLGKQGISLAKICLAFPTILHEIGHLIGFWHEHTRPDRGTYVDVLYNSINPKYLKNFEIVDPSLTDDLGVGYDYNSIMHYDRDAFSQYSGTTTLRARAGGIILGKAAALSPLDIEQTNLLYDCQSEFMINISIVGCKYLCYI